ncbi:unnamed protein product [Vitrella brassicaformis CCMP3155]|uniref:Peptide-methionine (R)-S-oxide reductase n=1 Tax=Vitrella brassicaformis (strain CCMP3155) TaxID=1169540 RepID=A0A0G4GHH7_VITBC|nr:unnamed protein product [Vitrella brassicaformis CCMP3155]|eukprot:CEM29185.1 unnamed protein product [Vitrella brassicaformis CCMP3155]
MLAFAPLLLTFLLVACDAFQVPLDVPHPPAEVRPAAAPVRQTTPTSSSWSFSEILTDTSRMSVGHADAALLAQPKISKSGYDVTPMTDEEVQKAAQGLTSKQYDINLKAGTEMAFTGETVNGYKWNTKEKGMWVGAISGLPLFSSDDKYDSGTGWLSFLKPVDPMHVIERKDPKDMAFGPFERRTEVLDAKSGAHLGHVFDDGPPPLKKRYCMNAASMKFVPAEPVKAKS